MRVCRIRKKGQDYPRYRCKVYIAGICRGQPFGEYWEYDQIIKQSVAHGNSPGYAPEGQMFRLVQCGTQQPLEEHQYEWECGQRYGQRGQGAKYGGASGKPACHEIMDLG